MKKVLKLKDLDCAHCANKMEVAINKIEGVSCQINFMASKMTFECSDEEFEAKLSEAKKIAKKIEPDCEIVG